MGEMADMAFEQWATDFNNDANEIMEQRAHEEERRNAAGLTAEQIQTINDRRQHIHDTAPCRYCRWPRRVCLGLNAQHAEANPNDPMNYADLCTGRPGFCVHREDPAALRQLTDEIMAGHIRTVAEVEPPPVLGPNLPSMTWLLEQDEWWYPHRRPAVRIAEMDRPWRWNTARYLERRAPELENRDRWRGIWADAPDDVMADLMSRTPKEFLDESPLYRAMTRKLPKVDTREGRRLAARAVHWNTCPMRHKHPGANDTCQCIREGGKVVGATNDPGSVA